MKVYDAASIRNVAVAGHGGCGKTQLVSALLFAAGMVNRLGRVDDGTTVTDYDPEEVARKHTLSTSLAYAEWRKTKINFLDTPGVANFFTDTRAALRVADAVLIVVDAVSGPAVQTEKAWAAADELGLPRLVALSRFDRDRASLERTIVALRKTCHRNVFPIHLPIGEGEACTGIVDVVGMKAFTAPVEGGPAVEGPVPDALVGEATGRAHGAHRDGRRGRRDADGDVLRGRHARRSRSHHRPAARHRCRRRSSRSSAPRRCATSASTPRSTPSSAGCRRPPTAVSARATPPAPRRSASGRLRRRRSAAFVWKTVADQFAGRITLFRVYQGVLTSDSTVRNVTRDSRRAARQPDADAGQDAGAGAGDPGRRHRRGGQAQGNAHRRHAGRARRPISPSRPSRSPEPVLSYAIEPKTRGDEDKISTAMHRLEEEDGAIHYARDPQHQRAASVGAGPAAHRGDGGQAEAPLRRRGGAQAAAHSLPRDHHDGGRGARPPQEADRRPRPVRRLQGALRAAAARRRLRVRRRDLRRLDPAPVHPGGREGPRRVTRARLPGRLPDGRLQGHALRRLVPRRRLERAVVQDRRLIWPSRTAWRGRGRRCSSRSCTSRSTPRRTSPAT